MEIEMKLAKRLKSLLVYHGPAGVTPTLYIKKHALPQPPPGTLRMTVGFDGELGEVKQPSAAPHPTDEERS